LILNIVIIDRRWYNKKCYTADRLFSVAKWRTFVRDLKVKKEVYVDET